MSYKIEKNWEHEGYRCIVVAIDMGHRCGYVGVDKEHPFYGKEYNDEIPPEMLDKIKTVLEGPIGKRGIIDLFCYDSDHPRIGILFDVHGGITFSSRKDDKKYPVESDLWFFGFDCAHSGDAKDPEITADRLDVLMYFNEGIIRTLDYCIDECESLAKQLKEISK
jgi:hypothetical protein